MRRSANKCAAMTIFLVMFTTWSSGQVIIKDSLTATQLVQKIIGNGITYSNPVLTCPPGFSGSFEVVSSNLGLDTGIVLATGKAETDASGIGINSPWLGMTWGPTAQGPGDSQLSQLVSQPTVEACILEFDFVPMGIPFRSIMFSARRSTIIFPAASTTMRSLYLSPVHHFPPPLILP